MKMATMRNVDEAKSDGSKGFNPEDTQTVMIPKLSENAMNPTALKRLQG